MPDQKTIDHCLDWIKKIEQDISSLVIGKHIYWQVQEIIRANSKINKENTFYDVFGDGYVAQSCMCVRRLVDADVNSVSFIRLLDLMEAKHELFNRTWYVSLWGSKISNSSINLISDNNDSEIIRQERERLILRHTREDSKKRGDEAFNDLAGTGSDYISANSIKQDKKTVESKAREIKCYANKILAHNDAKALVQGIKIPRHQDLNECIDVIEKKYLKYLDLLTQGKERLPTLLPEWQYDWKLIFRQTWIVDRKKIIRAGKRDA